MNKTNYLKQYKSLRKILRHNMTEHETILWFYLKSKQLGFRFRRQASIGNYIVDFYCPEKKLVIELDGGHHNENDYSKQDDIRGKYLKDKGLTILRIWNNEIKENLSGVIEEVKYYLEK